MIKRAVVALAAAVLVGVGAGAAIADDGTASGWRGDANASSVKPGHMVTASGWLDKPEPGVL